MEAIWTYLMNNKEWLFSGLGLFLIGGAYRFFLRRQSGTTHQTIRSGNASINIQAGRDIDIGRNIKSNVEQE